MNIFFEELTDGFTSPSFLENVRRKYHYREEQLAELSEVASKLLLSIRRDARWEHRIFREPSAQDTAKDQAPAYSEVLMTLGEGPDLLQKEYLAQNLLSECYMAECLTAELLLEGYAAYNQYIAAHTEFRVARYHFPGSEENFPLERLPEILARSEMPVRCNEALCMIPKKSVAFVAELTRDKSVLCQGVCAGCARMTCPNRTETDSQIRQPFFHMTDIPLHYGYSRIFGKKLDSFQS